jgi:molybdate transport system substrate-binding protein
LSPLGYRTPPHTPRLCAVPRTIPAPSFAPSVVSALAFVFALFVVIPSGNLLLAQAPHEPQIALHVAAAADLTPVLPALAADYEKQTGIHIVPSFGSSATLADQIRNGAPFDLFLSADAAHPNALAAARLTDAAPLPYAHGVLVLWARKDSPAQPLTLASLLKLAVAKVAVANPAHAPYGLAAKQALEHLNLDGKIAAKLVTAENIAQTAQFAESGNAQCGFLSLTTATTPHFRELGTFIPVPPETYAPIVQTAVVLAASPNRDAAHAFLLWLTSPATQARLHTFGLDPAK